MLHNGTPSAFLQHERLNRLRSATALTVVASCVEMLARCIGLTVNPHICKRCSVQLSSGRSSVRRKKLVLGVEAVPDDLQLIYLVGWKGAHRCDNCGRLGIARPRVEALLLLEALLTTREQQKGR